MDTLKNLSQLLGSNSVKRSNQKNGNSQPKGSAPQNNIMQQSAGQSGNVDKFESTSNKDKSEKLKAYREKLQKGDAVSYKEYEEILNNAGPGDLSYYHDDPVGIEERRKAEANQNGNSAPIQGSPNGNRAPQSQKSAPIQGSSNPNKNIMDNLRQMFSGQGS